ncbi:alpha/beta fold hydrolase [Paenibacillus chitinolyticus]|uniref:alpha/beta hydrolase family protein n=1 Tax=Paenibacillus chitinolyticus TaxID=79263 RepID=UPI002DB64B58|nr:alpha/beta fold hydrolase [Paenibacillus chitinolyticus]MEC0246720.1 alpha/beta fold hydrolase [Paenibacillus chitinolyticus]
MSWEQLEFGGTCTLKGIYEKPAQPDPEAPLIVTLPGLGQAMSEKNYLFSNLRKKLSPYGARVLQFDYRGHGDSEGELGDTGLSDMVSDTLEAIAAVCAEGRPRTIYLVGHALGAAVALLAAAELKRERQAACVPVLISPLLKALPKSAELFDSGRLAQMKRAGRIDSQELAPGMDYYTWSDFDPRHLDYFARLGSHMLYLHGQCIGSRILDELDRLDGAKLFREHEGEAVVVCGEADEDTIGELGRLGRFGPSGLNGRLERPARQEQAGPSDQFRQPGSPDKPESISEFEQPGPTDQSEELRQVSQSVQPGSSGTPLSVHLLSGVRYYYQHPAAMDELIGIIEHLWLTGCGSGTEGKTDGR